MILVKNTNNARFSFKMAFIGNIYQIIAQKMYYFA